MVNQIRNATYEVIEGSIPPKRDRSLNAGLDIAIQETRVLEPGETFYFRSGVKFNLPPEMKVDVCTRSSTFKKGVVVVPTIVDSNYKDEISTIVTNHTNEPVEIRRGSYLAQCVLTKWYLFGNEDMSSMNESDRLEHEKFGSSGD